MAEGKGEVRYWCELGLLVRGAVKCCIAVEAAKRGVTIKSVTEGPGWLSREVVWVFTCPDSAKLLSFVQGIRAWVASMREDD